jgi:hypothetical protein
MNLEITRFDAIKPKHRGIDIEHIAAYMSIGEDRTTVHATRIDGVRVTVMQKGGEWWICPILQKDWEVADIGPFDDSDSAMVQLRLLGTFE